MTDAKILPELPRTLHLTAEKIMNNNEQELCPRLLHEGEQVLPKGLQPPGFAILHRDSNAACFGHYSLFLKFYPFFRRPLTSTSKPAVWRWLYYHYCYHDN